MSEFGRPTGYVYKGSTAFRPEWVDPDDVRRYLLDELFIGDVLNFPCGMSDLGDLRVDFDESVNPDRVVDLKEPPYDLPRFDTVYCDPPFNYYNQDNEWVNGLWDLAESRLILNSPLKPARIEGAKKEWVILEPNAGTSGNNARALQVFDRMDQQLGDYIDS